MAESTPPPEQDPGPGASGQSGAHQAGTRDAGPPPTGGHGAVIDGIVSDLRRLRRARDGRVIGGVCAGLGRQLQVDPVLLRVVLAVLTLFGGIGPLLYAAAWLLIPEDGDDLSILERHLGRRRNGAPDAAVLAGGVVVVLLVVGTVPWWGFPWHVPVLLLLAVAGLVALVRRNADQDGDGGTPAGSTPGPGPAGGFGIAAQATPGAGAADAGQGGAAVRTSGAESSGTGATSGTGGEDASGDTDDTGESVYGSRTWSTAEPQPESFWNHPDPLGLESEPEPTEPILVPSSARAPIPARRRSGLFPVTVGAAVLGMIVVAMVDSGVDLPPAAYVATALGVVGVGLLVGTWVGRSRGLVALGILLAIALIPASLASSRLPGWSGPAGDFSLQPQNVRQIQHEYNYSAADVKLDLTQVDFAGESPVSTTINQGMGEILVTVPPNVDVAVTADLGAGDVELFGDSTGDLDFTESTVDPGADGPGGGKLNLSVDLGLGHLEVRRG